MIDSLVKKQKNDSPDNVMTALLERMISRRPFSLKFPRSLEHIFTHEYFEHHARNIHIAAVVGVFLLLLFGVLDWFIFSDLARQLLLVRIIIAVVLAAAFILLQLSFIQFPLFQNLYVVVIGLAFSIILALVPDEGRDIYFPGLVFIVFAAAIFMRLRVFSMLVSGSLIVVNYNFLLLWITSIGSMTWWLQNLYLLSSVILVVILSFIFERSERVRFLQKNLLELGKKELETANKGLQKLTIEDNLTRVANKRYFDQAFAEEWQRGLRSRFPITLMMLEIDKFKSFSDHYGHEAGEKAIKEVAARLNQFAKRPGDIVARYDAQVFAILFSGTPIEYGTRLALKICRAIESLEISHEQSEAASCLTVSVGISFVLANANRKPEDLLGAAKLALNQAKNNGQNQVAVKHLPAEIESQDASHLS